MNTILKQKEIDELNIFGKIDEVENAIVNAKLLLQSIDSELAEDLHDKLEELHENDLTDLYNDSKEERRLTTLDCNICNVAFDVEENTESTYADDDGDIICDGCR